MPVTRGGRTTTPIEHGDGGDELPLTGSPLRDARDDAAQRSPISSEEHRVNREHEEMLAKVRIKRKRREIEALRKELEGQDPDMDVEIDGVSLPQARRQRDDRYSRTSFLTKLKNERMSYLPW